MAALLFQETDKMILTLPTVHHHMSNSHRHGEDVTEWVYQNQDDPAMHVSVWLSIQMSMTNHFLNQSHLSPVSKITFFLMSLGIVMMEMNMNILIKIRALSIFTTTKSTIIKSSG